MSDTATTPAGEASENVCPRCQARNALSHRFCSSCGLEFPPSLGAVNSYIAMLLPKTVDSALKDRLKEQKLVEVETSELIAERAMKWMKLTGFFVGLPLLLFGAFISFVGIKTYTDIEKLAQRVTDSQPKLDAAIKRAEAMDMLLTGAEAKFTAINLRIASLDETAERVRKRLDTELPQLREQQQKLEQDLGKLRERLAFTDSKALTPAQREELQDRLARYIAHLERLGFTKLDQKVTVRTYSKDERLPPPHHQDDHELINAFYVDRTIFMHRDLAGDPSVALREYTHHALLSSLGERGKGFGQDETETALADYFAAGFMGQPLIGADAAKRMGLPKGYIRTLEHDQQFVPTAHFMQNGEVWAAALWRCRKSSDPSTIDRIVVTAWHLSFVPGPSARTAKTFGAALIEAAGKEGSEPVTACFTNELARRKLPH